MALLSLGNRALQKSHLHIYVLLKRETKRKTHLQCISDSLPVKHQHTSVFLQTATDIQQNCREEWSQVEWRHLQVLLKALSAFRFPYVSYLMVSVQSSPYAGCLPHPKAVKCFNISFKSNAKDLSPDFLEIHVLVQLQGTGQTVSDAEWNSSKMITIVISGLEIHIWDGISSYYSKPSFITE